MIQGCSSLEDELTLDKSFSGVVILAAPLGCYHTHAPKNSSPRAAPAARVCRASGARASKSLVRHGEPRGSKEAQHMHKKFDRISVNPEVMNGQPCIRDMRLTVRRVVESVALYPDWKELQEEYPELDNEDIRQALEFAATNLDTQTIDWDVA